MNTEKIEIYIDKAIELAIGYTPKVLLAIITIIAGFTIVGFLVKIMNKMMRKFDVEKSLQTFLDSLVRIVLRVLVIFSAIGILGVQTTSFIAVIGAIGLAVAMALSGTLQNFAGGVIILLFKPFKVGDTIEFGGEYGEVLEIQIFNTVMRARDNRTVVMPNGEVSSTMLINYSTQNKIRLDIVVGISYDSDIDQARKIMEQVAKEHVDVMQNERIDVVVYELADSSVNMKLRVYTKMPTYRSLRWQLQEAVKKAFDANGVSIPFPQRDVHLYEAK